MKERKGRKNKAGKRAARTALRAAPDPASTAARDSVLSTPELLECILLHLPLQALLTTALSVSKTWNTLISTSPVLQRRLFFAQEDPSTCTTPGPPTPNPMLQSAFPSLLDNPSCHLSIARMTRLAFAIADTRAGRRRHLAFSREGASWRRMLPMQPAPRTVRFRAGDGYLRPGPWRAVAVPEGVRMGPLYDLVYDVVWGNVSPGRGGEHWVDVLWGYTGGGLEAPRDPDVLAVQECVEGPERYRQYADFTLRRKHMLGSAWMFRCEEYDKRGWPGLRGGDPSAAERDGEM